MSKLQDESRRRRTFAIISHPDAGKTTLTEKILLYGGAIHLAGAVKAKKTQRHTTSDWMEIEKQRGISISASVLNFEYNGAHVNLLDTPGHKDFSEDTYRTLAAVDAAVMLIDAAKGVEPQTLKLFEVCRMRGLPIFTFINKMDRPSRDPLDLLDELERVLGIRSSPVTWPIGSGDRFKGVYDRQSKEILVFQPEGEANAKGKILPVPIKDFDDPKFESIFNGDLELKEQFESEIELLEVAGDGYDQERVNAGGLSPVFFGSAMNNFGVQRFLNRFVDMAPSPGARKTKDGKVPDVNGKFSGFVFKIQANMDPQHRDRVAFIRVCTGRFEKNMMVKHVRLNKSIRLSRPLNFFAQDRILVDEAYPGDILGLVDSSGAFRIGDTLAEAGNIEYEQIPSFSPEFFAQAVIRDPMKRKQLKKGLEQLAEEGVIQIYYQPELGDKDPILAAVGSLQFEVLKQRLLVEYSVNVEIQNMSFTQARWISGNGFKMNLFSGRSDSKIAIDRDQNPVALFSNEWAMRWAQENYSDITLSKSAPL